VVDRERVLRLLNRIERDVGVLADLARGTASSTTPSSSARSSTTS